MPVIKHIDFSKIKLSKFTAKVGDKEIIGKFNGLTKEGALIIIDLFKDI